MSSYGPVLVCHWYTNHKRTHTHTHKPTHTYLGCGKYFRINGTNNFKSQDKEALITEQGFAAHLRQ